MAAYTAVSTRRHLTPSNQDFSSPVQPTPKQISSQAAKTAFSPLIREYVSRSFASEHFVNGVSREETEAKLKQIINDAARSGKLENIDWKTYPLPQQMIQQERIAALSAQAAPPSSPPPKMSSFTLGKKRKSDTLSVAAGDASMQSPSSSSSTPPWKRENSVNSPNALQDRITQPDENQNGRADKRQRRFQEATVALRDSSKTNGDLERRRQRFNIGGELPGAKPSASDSASAEAHSGPIVGTCQKLEKRYLRLTDAPKPENVRPLEVLKKTLDLLTKKWRVEHDYNYVCDQFKSLRQDLTVQHITNEFTVKAYEKHARIALEKGDIGEFNQCQTQLRALYKRKLGGHPGEFLAYRILYFIYTSSRTDMNNVLADLTAADRADRAVQHALRVRSALALGNYHRFFKLYVDTPNMGVYLIDLFVARERLAALATLSKTYKPDVPLEFVADELAFENVEQCSQFLQDSNVPESLLEHKDGKLRFASGKAIAQVEAIKVQAFRGVDIKGQI